MKNNNTAIPFAVVAALLLIVVVVAETLLTGMQDTQQTIQLVASQANLDEDREVTVIMELQPEQLHLANQLLTELKQQLPLASLPTDPRLFNLTEDQKSMLFSYIGVALNKEKNYKSAISLLLQVNLQDRLDHQSQFSFAYAQFKLKNFEPSLSAYQKLLQHDPQHQSAALNKALLLKRMQNCNEAVTAFEYSIKISSGIKKSKAHAGLSECYINLKQYPLAKTQLNSAIEYRPSYAKNWQSMAKLARLQNASFNEVNDLYKKAAQLDDKGHSILLEWAKYQISMLDFQGAIITLRTAQRRAKKSIRIRRLLVISYLEANKPNNTRKQAKKLLRVENNSNREFYAKALMAYAKEDYKGAYSLTKKLSKKKLEYQYLKAICAAKAGKKSIADKLLNVLAENSDYRFRAKRHLALLYKSRKNYAAAAAIYAELTQVQAYSSTLWIDSARLAQKQEDFPQAIRYLDQGLSIANNDKTLLMAKSNILLKQLQFTKAINLLNLLSRHHPKDLKIRNKLANSLYQNGQHMEAYGHYQLLLERNPDDVKLLYKLAKIAAEQSRWQDSIMFLNVLLEHQANHVEARYQLASAYCRLNEYLLCQQQAILTLKLKNDHSGAKALLKSTNYEG